ncbi:cyanoexosortase A [Pseudanabaena sp. UWO310]|uniref:cyanoexosortase A n=1 Tax=Pseudanabaena sp. UWO310 TaxID=2480795 RepID=UPI001160CE39|nr:cyanoexosortase A [Pseudanabaena sp. UWO310]TYQ25346.1 cyanoexosortase A [Pseudanabaena sp. UWO310]
MGYKIEATGRLYFYGLAMLDHILRGNFSNLQDSLHKATRKLEFWLLAIWTSFMAINITLVVRLGENIDEIAIQILTWAVALLLVIRNRSNFKFESTPSAIAIGTLLIIWVLLKSLLTRRTTDILFILTPVMATVGVALIGSGWKGLKQYWQPILLAATLGIPVAFLFAAIEKVIPVNVFTAQFANTALWYGGVKVAQNGITIVSQFGAVEVARGCAGLPPILMLLRITLMFVLVFPVSKIHRWIMFPAAIAIAFIVNSLRVALLVIVSGQADAFKYWHAGDGSQIFSVAAVALLLGLCNFLTKDDEDEYEDEYEDI